MSSERAPIKVFYCYAHEDESLRDELGKHLSILERQGLISTFHDRQIVTGGDWSQFIEAHLETASLILLLISPAFLASDYCYNVEMKRALERHQAKTAQVIPILLRPVYWQHAPFAHLQMLPSDGRAVTEWENPDAAFRDIVAGIRTIILLNTQASKTTASLGESTLYRSYSRPNIARTWFYILINAIGIIWFIIKWIWTTIIIAIVIGLIINILTETLTSAFSPILIGNWLLGPALFQRGSLFLIFLSLIIFLCSAVVSSIGKRQDKEYYKKPYYSLLEGGPYHETSDDIKLGDLRHNSRRNAKDISDLKNQYTRLNEIIRGITNNKQDKEFFTSFKQVYQGVEERKLLLIEELSKFIQAELKKKYSEIEPSYVAEIANGKKPDSKDSASSKQAGGYLYPDFQTIKGSVKIEARMLGSNNSEEWGIFSIDENPLTFTHLLATLSVIHELAIKSWLIAQSRLTDLALYTYTHDLSIAEEAPFFIRHVTYNSPFQIEINFVRHIGTALRDCIDAVSHSKERLKQAQLDTQERLDKTKRENNKENHEQRMRDLEYEQKLFHLEKEKNDYKTERVLEAIKIAEQMISTLNPNLDQDAKTAAIQNLLPNILQLYSLQNISITATSLLEEKKEHAVEIKPSQNGTDAQQQNSHMQSIDRQERSFPASN